MRKKNQLADLRRLIALPSRDVKRRYLQFIYEDSSAVISMLFDLAQSPPNRLERNNILLLLKVLLDDSDEYHASIPDWMANELNVFIKNPRFTDPEKALVLSSFDPEELFRQVLTFEKFVQRFMDIHESFEDYIVREIRSRRTRLYDIFYSIRERTEHRVILSMIEDLKDSRHREAAEMLELFSYCEHPSLASAAFQALLDTDSPAAGPALQGIAQNHPQFHEEAAAAFRGKRYAGAHEAATAAPPSPGDIWCSLADGTGTLTIIIGRKMRRNDYLFSHILCKAGIGIKKCSLYTALSSREYGEAMKGYRDKLPLYRIGDALCRRILGHFIVDGMQAGFSVPAELIALKNIVGWADLSPGEFVLSREEVPEVRYTMRDLEKFPLGTWWLNDNRVYNLLAPYQLLDYREVPERVLAEVAGLYLEFARKELRPLCDLCAAVVSAGQPSKGRRFSALFRIIGNDLAHPPADPFDSLFVSFQTISTVYNTLHNLKTGVKSIELS